jgi:undecaprenyl-diphosphatase
VTVLQAFVLGVLQGLSEFLPISSSAHLTLVPWLFHWRDPGLAFDVALHFGTLIAVLWYFGAEWASLIGAAASIVVHRRIETDEERRVIFLIVATIPGAIAGLALENYAETAFRDPRLVATVLIIMGIVLWWVDKRARQDRPLPTMRWIDREFRSLNVIGVTMIALAVVLLLAEVYGKRKVKLDGMTLVQSQGIGWAQVLGLVPGASRSGSTITAGRGLGLTREAAAVFSFLMSMPIIAAASLVKLPHVLKTEGIDAQLVVGVLASALSGWLAISVLLRFVVRRSYGVFAVYRVVVGLAVLAIAFTR